MTPLEIRKLIGGYATGSLSDAERQLLFEAALEDQELFDELMGEHALKELLEEPGAKARLIAALAPVSQPPKPFWNRAWPWAAASAAVALGVALSFGLFRPSPPKQFARVFTQPSPVIVEPVPSPLPAPPELRIAPPPAPKVEAKAVLPPPPVLASVSAQPQAESVVVTAAAPLVQPPTPRAAQFAAGLVAGSQAALTRPDFIYTFSDDRKLRVTPLVNGFLTVIENTGRILASNREVQVSVAVEFAVPDDGNMITAFLTPQPSAPLEPPENTKAIKIPIPPRREK
jgi:hypothetical protein